LGIVNGNGPLFQGIKYFFDRSGVKVLNKVKVIGYRHTGIIVKNLDESLSFYEDFLGLKLLQKHIDDSEYISKVTGINGIIADYAKLEIPGGQILELLSYPSHNFLRAERGLIQPGEAHLAFQVSSIEDAYASVVAANIPYISAPIISSEKIAKVFFCLDPDKYRVEFVEMLSDSYSWKPNNDNK
jgi:catechol 2,3-dioxygenase-like lactoylglutathione lyase family enzyme